MRNENLRQAKIARNKKKRQHHNKAYDRRQKCEDGACVSNRIKRQDDEFFNKLQKELGL